MSFLKGLLAKGVQTGLTAAGGFFGGPAGAAAGAAAGGAIGGKINPPKQGPARTGGGGSDSIAPHIVQVGASPAPPPRAKMPLSAHSLHEARTQDRTRMKNQYGIY
jgi:hypothetical protein